LQAASAGGHGRIVERLLEHGADVNAQGGGLYDTALQAASASGHNQVAEQLKSVIQSR
jgi:ankyrin repeat protein